MIGAMAETAAPADLLTIEEVCDILKVSRSVLYLMRRKGEGPPAIMVGHRLRYRRPDLDRWIKDQPTSNGQP